MPVSIENRKKRYKRQAILGVCVCVVLLLPCVAFFGGLSLFAPFPTWVRALMAIGAILCLLPIGVALAALKQRFKEIEGGELDAAAEY